MPYKKSKSRIEFENSFLKLLSLSREISYKKVNLSYNHKNLIYQSCIVLLSSSFEEFLKTLIEDIFQNYKSRSAPLKNIPVNVRTFTLFQNQKKFYDSFNFHKDEGRIIENLNIRNSFYDIITEDSILTNHINARSITNDKKYPSPKNLKMLFNRLGIKNIFSVIDSAGGKQYELLLRSFLDVRETIAHQEFTDLTFTDVKRHYDNVNEIINRIDRALYKHICTESGSHYW